MNALRGLDIIIRTLIFLAIGAVLILLSLNLFTSDELLNMFNYVYTQANVKLVVGIVGAIFILIGLLTAHINFGIIESERTIAFENPEGEVTVSLSAIEDFVKKSVRHFPEVKELRSTVTASKKGINIVCRATIFADTNIPETTARIQCIVKSKVCEMLGVEETINIRIHVTKISPKGKGEVEPPREYEEMSRRMPLSGLE